MNDYRHLIRCGDGFSLLEALVAMALAGMVAVGILTSVGIAVSSSGMAQETTVATMAGVEQIEMFNALPFGDPQLQAGGSINSSQTGYSLDPLNGDSNAYMRWVVVDESFQLKRITIVVGVRDSNVGSWRESRFETFRILSQ